jgi:hypothetical protein
VILKDLAKILVAREKEMKIENERGVVFTHAETKEIFDRLRTAQWRILNDDVSGCAWMSTTISNAIAYMALLENEVLQLRMEIEILKAKDEDKE